MLFSSLDLNPVGDRLVISKLAPVAHSLLLSPMHRLNLPEILLKGPYNRHICKPGEISPVFP